MVFSSFTFLFAFFPLILVIYFFPPFRKREVRNGILLLFSLAFYSFGGWRLMPVIFLSIVINYICGRLSDSEQKDSIRKVAVAGAIICNLLLLFVFKYLGFLTENLHQLFPGIPVKELVLPIGISFYTFQGLSYVIDVFRGEVRAERNLLRIALYIALFPQLVAGPIVRYTTIAGELRNRKESWENFEQGVIRFLFGLAKKVLLANSFAQIADSIFAQTSDQLSTSAAWLGIAAYTLQIYFDFSGYSDMAIGLGRIFGFHFLENFNYPYVAISIKDFWRRWHISLSTWFRDYVYIPLGGNRGSKGKHLRNLLIVWGLTGFWHGAAWTYLLWGIYYAVLLIGERYIWGKILEKLPKIVQHVYALFFILIGWLIFRAVDINQLFTFLTILCGAAGTGVWDHQTTYFLLEFRWEWIFGVIASLPLKQYIQRFIDKNEHQLIGDFLVNWGKPFFALILGGLSVLSLTSTGYNPFIYFQF